MNLPGSLRSEKRLNPAHPQWISPVLKLLKLEFFHPLTKVCNLSGSLSAGDDVNFALVLAERNSTVAESEQSVVAAATDIVAGTETGAALTDDDGSCGNSFAAKGFDSEEFGIAVATVAAAGLTFLMSHDITSKFYVNCY